MLRSYVCFPFSDGIFFTGRILLLNRDIWVEFLALLQTASLTVVKSVSVIFLYQKWYSTFTHHLFSLIPFHLAFTVLG